MPRLSVHVGVKDARDESDRRRLVWVVLRKCQTYLRSAVPPSFWALLRPQHSRVSPTWDVNQLREYECQLVCLPLESSRRACSSVPHRRCPRCRRWCPPS